ncbi:MAG: hypothetical protein KJ077_27925 [Anaerolineae bacterium]|nr:hypothetical protein [Anaerolineae bacterium]
MPNNRHLITDYDVIRPAQLLDKGLPLPGLSGRYVVDEGWCAVITEGGAFKEILQPGTYSLSKYQFWRDVKAIAIDTRIQTLTISTTREFTIAQPVPVEINLDLAVEYRVSDSRRVALEIKTPLTSLYDRVIQAVRGAVVYATVDEIRTQGEGIARTTLQRLQAMQLPKIIGIEIFNILVTGIKATDTGNDALASQQLKEYTTLRDWQVDATMTGQSRVTWEWLLIHRPEIAQQILATHGEIAKELIDKGLLDPAGFLNRPTSSTGSVNLPDLMNNFGFPGSMLPGGQSQAQLPGQSLPANPDQLPAGKDIHARIREEIGYLKKIPGARVEAKPGTDSDDVPDGSYVLRVEAPRNSGGQITLYFFCLAGYPQLAPAVEVEVDEQSVPFQSAVLRRWTGQYLVEIVREVQQWIG